MFFNVMRLGEIKKTVNVSIVREQKRAKGLLVK